MNARTMGMLLCAAAAGVCVCGAARQKSGTDKEKDLWWAPPNVDAALPQLASVPACDTAKVLQEAAKHAVELTSNLENFSAEEEIRYEMLNQSGFPESSDAGLFDYVFALERQGSSSGSREYRTPAKGGHEFPASGQDTGQVALALIFLPNMQTDYQMSCEGLDKWKEQAAWVVRFQQRKDKPGRTLQIYSQGKMHRAMLKGRAWISVENGQVLHLETKLMEDIPAIDLRGSSISVEYAPVMFQSKNVELWLPQRIKAYWTIGSHRIILYHTYRSFHLFAVETEENIQKPKEQ